MSAASYVQVVTPGRPAQIRALTSLRGLLALWVVLFHFWNDIVTLFPALGAVGPLTIRGSFAVPGFFALSGFVLARNHDGDFVAPNRGAAARFWGLRLFRIYPVHVTTLLTVLVMVIYAQRVGLVLDSKGYTWTQFVLNLLLAQTWPAYWVVNWNFPAWSISSEWFAYLLFPLLSRWLTRLVVTVEGLALAFATAIGATIGVYLGWGNWPFWGLVVVLPPFVAGMLASSLGEKCSRTSSLPSWLPEACVAVIAVACFAPGQIALGVLLSTLVLLVLGLGAGCSSARGFWEWPPLIYLGEVSYSLYMTHTLVLKVTNRLLPSARFELSGLEARFGVLVAYASLLALACAASYYLVEAPIRKLSRRWLRPRLYPQDGFAVASVSES